MRMVLFTRPFYKREFTRLSHVRTLLEDHKTFDKEQVLGTEQQQEGQEKEGKQQQKDQFLWTYVLRPSR